MGCPLSGVQALSLDASVLKWTRIEGAIGGFWVGRVLRGVFNTETGSDRGVLLMGCPLSVVQALSLDASVLKWTRDRRCDWGFWVGRVLRGVFNTETGSDGAVVRG
jgi:hypothetical protein